MHSILLVDDDPEILAAWQAILLDEGYTVCCARNGLQALEHLKESVPDLVITDWMMPLMGGAELCRQLKAHPDLAHVPVSSTRPRRRVPKRCKRGMSVCKNPRR